MLDLSTSRALGIFIIALVFIGWFLAGIDSVDGSGYSMLHPLVVSAITLSPLPLLAFSAAVAPNWRAYYPSIAYKGVLGGAAAIGLYAAYEGGISDAIGVVFLALTFFGILPYIVIAISITIGLGLGLSGRWFLRKIRSVWR